MTTRVASGSVVCATTVAEVVPTGNETVWSSTTAFPLTVKTDNEVSVPALAEAALTWIGRMISTVAASMETRPRARVINKLKALPSQES